VNATAKGALPHHVIEPDAGWMPLQLVELWRYRELVYFLTWRDISVRYKQTLLGAAWAIIQPVFTMIVFSIFLGGLAKVPSDGLPYPLFAFCALVPWTYFSYALTHGANSLVDNANLVTKVYFPRILIPLSAVLGGLPDLVIAFLVLVAMMAFYGIHLTAAVLWLPLLVGLALLTAFAVTLWLSALNVHYRDFRYTIPFMVQLWLFATPVAYPSSLIPPAWRILYGINPMAGVIEGFRWSLLGIGHGPGLMLAVSAGIVATLLVSGLFYFKRVEGRFADIV
jgi:lipopolysaccharide transport system permease protein